MATSWMPRLNRSALSYLVACAVLALLLGSQSASHRWGADVWHHGAVVRTLAEDLANPRHPVLPLEAPHQFIVPPSLLAAAIVAVTPAEPLDAMVAVAALNLVLLLTGIWFFARAFCRQSPWSPLLALLFSLFLWGPNPWGYSGFLHMNQIGQSLPYPSAFAFGAALLALAAYVRWIEARRASHLVASMALAPLVILSHPVASILLCTVISTFLIRHVDKASAWIGAVGMGLASLAAALAWPYYPFFAVLEASHVFDASNRVLYDGVLLRTFPLLPGFAVVVARLRRDRRDPLAFSILGLSGIYVVGLVLGRWSLGRVLSPLAFLLQVALAIWIAQRLPKLVGLLTEGRHRLTARFVGAALVALAVANMAPGFARTMPPALLPERLAGDPRLAPIDHRHRFLEGLLGYGDVVLARPRVGWPVPTYGGKILASDLPQAFVDTTAMHADLETFFAPESDQAMRQDIARRYDARWILVDEADPFSAQVLPELRRMAEPVAGAEGLHLLSIPEARP